MKGLFSSPCASRTELRERIANINLSCARRLVVNHLFSQDLAERHGPLILAVLDEIGIGEERPRLMELALDIRRAPRVRMWAAMALAGKDPNMMGLLIDDLGPGGMADLAENAVVELITIQSPERVGGTILRALSEWHRDPHSARLLRRIDACRKALGISCADAYHESLESNSLGGLRGKLLDYFVREGSEEGIALLERMRQETADEEEGRLLQSALLRLRSTRIDPIKHKSEGKGRALVSNCDGQGGVLVLGIFENPDGTHSVSELYIRAGGGIIEGGVHGRIDRRSSDGIVRHHELDTNCLFVETTLGESAALIAGAATRTQEAVLIRRPEVRQAMMLFKQVDPGFRWGDDACCPPAPTASLEDIHALLSRPEYERTWIFDLEDWKRYGFSTAWAPERETEDARFLLDPEKARPLRARLLAMAEHMARWHFWKGEDREAGLCLALLEDIRRDLQESDLVRAMWVRSRY